jgi:hypothetical protein
VLFDGRAEIGSGKTVGIDEAAIIADGCRGDAARQEELRLADAFPWRRTAEAVMLVMITETVPGQEQITCRQSNDSWQSMPRPFFRMGGFLPRLLTP